MEKAIPALDPANPPRFITAAEAARELRVSTKWFYEQMRMNLGPRAIKIGKKKYRIPYGDFLQWCESPLRQARPRRKAQRKIAP